MGNSTENKNVTAEELGRELIKLGTATVVMSSDGEGNRFGLFGGVSKERAADMRDMDVSGLPSSGSVVVLWPYL